MGRRKFDSRGKNRRKETRGDDASWRLTHLLAASHLLAGNAPSVSRALLRTSRQIGKRLTMTMDSVTVKRRICKQCHTLLLPNGPTPMRVRVASKRETHVVLTCVHCGYARRFPARPARACEVAPIRDVLPPL